MESNPHTETRLTEEALKRKLKERLEAMSASKTKRKIAAAKTETTPSSPTSSDDMLELIKASGPAADAKPEVKPPFTSTKYIKLNG
jgi:hypothetical protein